MEGREKSLRRQRGTSAGEGPEWKGAKEGHKN